MSTYTKRFFDRRGESAGRSAETVVPIVLELLRPKRVVDVGCALGTWLSVFMEHGVEEVLGVDGDWVDTAMLKIPSDRFVTADLQKPVILDERFDLVVSLEVAEHLPEECAAAFVDSLTALGPVMLFSAAIPMQRGTGHVNEQWPDYWVDLFREHNYVVVDCLRRRIWQDRNVTSWYAQNMMMFVERAYLTEYPELDKEARRTVHTQLSLVHPTAYLKACKKMLELRDPRNMSWRKIWKAVRILARYSLSKK